MWIEEISFEALVVWLVETEPASASVSTKSKNKEEEEVLLSSELDEISEISAISGW